MCGFAGVVAWADRFRATREMIGGMSARVAHRGPDGEGILLNHEVGVSRERPQVGLAHRRLAILDLDPRANQPFGDGQGRWVVFNGEIYNFRALRAELSSLRPDYNWRTTGDTEVLLVAYLQWGGECVRHFEGMFAFALWDEPQKSLLLARDRMGQKPLYVATVRDPEGDGGNRVGAVAFASEVGALFALPWVDRSIDHAGLVEYLAWGHTSFAQSIYRGIDQVAPGAIRVAVEGKISGDLPYWSERESEGLEREGEAPAEPSSSSQPRLGGSLALPSDVVSATREWVARAVRDQLVSDVPVGCFLSGGMDSSVVAAAMKAAMRAGQRPLTFSIGFDDPRYDEREYAAQVAAHLGTEHRAFVVRPDAAADLPKIAEAFGEPFGDSSALPTYYLARETRRHVKVALSGDGGDELFGGYDRYRAMLLGRRLRTALTPLPWAALAPVLRQLPGGHPKSRWDRARRFATSLGLPAAQRYSSYRRLFDGPLLRRLLRPEISPDLLEFDRVVASFAPGDPLRAAMASDRRLYLPDDLLTKVDRTSMQFALEVRSPFMDHRLVSFAAGLSREQLISGGLKRMLREAFAADLPGWVFRRRKMGFAVPIGQWFRGELREMLHDHLNASDSFASSHFAPWVLERLISEHQRQRIDHSQRLFSLLMLELWWRSVKARQGAALPCDTGFQPVVTIVQRKNDARL
ncbi:MAG TPA: asparagine synthase (glutamine-hydrolyzing) [Tepidisphaeraceae bacterium]|jgi:asparagine synthase (glutamine-hydrolysing)